MIIDCKVYHLSEACFRIYLLLIMLEENYRFCWIVDYDSQTFLLNINQAILRMRSFCEPAWASLGAK